MYSWNDEVIKDLRKINDTRVSYARPPEIGRAFVSGEDMIVPAKGPLNPRATLQHKT